MVAKPTGRTGGGTAAGESAIGSRPDSVVERIVGAAVRAGALAYCRERHLGGLIGVGPDLVSDQSTAAGRLILARLKQALRAERRRARAGHWAYDINRHIALRQACMAETARLQRTPPPGGRRSA